MKLAFLLSGLLPVGSEVNGSTTGLAAVPMGAASPVAFGGAGEGWSDCGFMVSLFR